MPAAEVVRVLHALRESGIDVCVDGGWAVDAALGEQTRLHADLDLVGAASDHAATITALAPLGYLPAEDDRPIRFVLRAPGGRAIDFHTVTFDAEGGGLQPQPDGSLFRYPPEGFGGNGTIDGEPVKCLSAEFQLLCHSGYEPDEDDRRDMRLLAARFGLKLPPSLA
ncbi:MAG TPA: amino acid transporter [Dehalococcoidia bacterium]|nr:amino acid transporter [Dehalococcoidia bacterium]